MANMKQRDLQACGCCKKGVMSCGNPMFYRIKLDGMIVDVRAVERQHGMEMMMGAAAPVAQLMGPDEDMAVEVASKEFVICMDCALTSSFASLIGD